jgi:hypothetical protein
MKLSARNIVIILVMAVVGFYVTTGLIKHFGN